MSLSVYKPNPLAYPGNRLPGFDPSHIAARKVRMSAVMAGPSNVLAAKAPTINATTFIIDPVMGQSAKMISTTTSGVTFSGPAVLDTVLTVACIFYWVVQNTNVPLLYSANSSTAGGGLQFFNSALFLAGAYSSGNSAVFTPFSTTTNVPYFVAVSFTTTIANCAMVNLTTGQFGVRQTSISNSALTASDGNYVFGSGSGIAANPLNVMAAGMISGQFMSLQELEAWAADPWAFWYPRTLTDTMFDSLALVSVDVLQAQIIM